MIRYYCQYSYGGFKTFRINGVKHEELTQEVTPDNNYGFPKLADLYFNQGGVKVLYRYLDSNTIDLVIREIPGPGLDTDNRQINCAIQFIGDASDRPILDRLTIKLLNNLSKFELDFADMFDLRGGLHFDGDRLAALVQECQEECEYEGKSVILDISGRDGEVLFFVPSSTLFGVDAKTTEKILAELQLPKDATERARHISQAELNKIQNLIEVKPTDHSNTPSFSSTDDSENSPSDIATLQLELEKARRALSEKDKECKGLRNSAREYSSEAENCRSQFTAFEEKAKIIGIIGGAILGISILVNIIKLLH